MNFVLSPAYGRDYNSGKAAKAAFAENVDFVNETREWTGGGTYINREQIPDGSRVQIRFKQLRGSCSLVKS